MKFTTVQGLLCVLIGALTVGDTNTRSATPRTTSIAENQATKQLGEQASNISSPAIITDIRTPPKVKQMINMVGRKTENVHPGSAEPIDGDLNALEESMKKLHFYKIEKPTTTDSGLSTWILLSGQSVSSSLTSTTTNSPKDASLISSSGVIKPLFKQRPPASKTTTTTATPKIKTPTAAFSTMLTTSTYSKLPTKQAQIKVAAMNNSKYHINKVNVTITNPPKFEMNVSDVEMVKVKPIFDSTTTYVVSSTELAPAELKEGYLELPPSTTNPKKSRRPTNKTKKDKNRRKRPSTDKSDAQNKTKISNKVGQKEKPISTQIYNYLAKEVMPTVGVGLVGLVVTAGLASYFLYPFGSLRRSYDVDRRDKDSYYYNKGQVSLDYDSGIAEEEVIGKVIAGMPFSSNNIGNSYQQKSSKHSYTNNRRVGSNNYFTPKGIPETIQLPPVRDQLKNENYIFDTRYLGDVNKNEPVTFNRNVIPKNIEESYTNTGHQFVVGNLPKDVNEEITPAAVPEHGPRSLKIRKRRQTESDAVNEIDVDEPPQMFEKKKDTTISITGTQTLKEQMYNFLDTLKDLFTSKLKGILNMLQNQTVNLSRYLDSMQQNLTKLQHNSGTKN